MNSGLDVSFTINYVKLFSLFYADDQVVFCKSSETVQAMLYNIDNYCNM